MIIRNVPISKNHFCDSNLLIVFQANQFRVFQDYKTALRKGDDGGPDWAARISCNYMASAKDVRVLEYEVFFLNIFLWGLLEYTVDWWLPHSWRSQCLEGSSHFNCVGEFGGVCCRMGFCKVSNNHVSHFIIHFMFILAVLL